MVRWFCVNFPEAGVVLLIWIIVGQGPIALAVAGVVWTFFLSSIISFLSPSLWETALYKLKYCLEGPLSPKQPTNQPTFLSPSLWETARNNLKYCLKGPLSPTNQMKMTMYNRTSLYYKLSYCASGEPKM